MILRVNTCIGIVSTGAMGSGLGRTWRDGGARVVATIAGRSARTAELARAARVELLPGLDDVLAASDVVVSIGPPAQAPQMAAAIAAATARVANRPLVADLNAVSPATVTAIAEQFTAIGQDFVDGAISGGPPEPGGATRLYLSGPQAGRIAALPADGLIARVVGDRIGAASAVKMCTASVRKGFSALMVQALLTARAHGAADVVVDDLRRGFAHQMDEVSLDIAISASTAWRFVGEMREIAATQDAAGTRRELFEAMAEVWEMVAQRQLAVQTPEQALRERPLADVLDELARPA